jgi:hypothetical protein
MDWTRTHSRLARCVESHQGCMSWVRWRSRAWPRTRPHTLAHGQRPRCSRTRRRPAPPCWRSPPAAGDHRTLCTPRLRHPGRLHPPGPADQGRSHHRQRCRPRPRPRPSPRPPRHRASSNCFSSWHAPRHPTAKVPHAAAARQWSRGSAGSAGPTWPRIHRAEQRPACGGSSSSASSSAEASGQLRRARGGTMERPDATLHRLRSPRRSRGACGRN